MHLTFCGTGQAYLDPQRAGAAIFVEHDGRGLLLDCGPGSLERMLAAGHRIEQIEAVLLSHLHFDHTLAVPELLIRLAFAEAAMPSFHGPEGTHQYLDGAIQFARTQLGFLVDGFWVDRIDGIDVCEPTPAQRKLVAGMEVEPRTVPHAPDIHALAWRVEAGGHALVYSGDTSATGDGFVDFARNADVLIHESYTAAAIDAHTANMPPSRRAAVLQAFSATHSEVGRVARIAREAGVGTLVLTHVLPTESESALQAEAERDFDGAIVVARDRLTISV